jgi:hypothetical protein
VPPSIQKEEPMQETAPKMVAMKLERNYRPAGDTFEIVGHTRPEIKRKDPSGKEVVIQKEEWIAGEAMPSAIPGAGFANKIWAGTVISLPLDEAKTVQKNRIGVPELA